MTSQAPLDLRPASLLAPFDLLGPLPTGTTVLQASAGTGKTFTVAGLVARYIAEGHASMDELLVVSFSRESTRELRERVRERLVSSRDALAAPDTIDPRDLLAVHLATVGHEDELNRRRRRLEEALAGFDAATVTTTHGFCQQVLLALGTAGDHDPAAVLVEDIADLVREVADDLYLRKWGLPGSEAPQLSQAEFHELALAVVSENASLVPAPSAGGVPGLRARIASVVRSEVARRKRRLQVIDYDDLVLQLAATLTDPELGPAARRRLRERYRIVLVDEFQDTDPVQWDILREPFHQPDGGTGTLVLIGDPKQAIYGFRGADVHAYLNAVDVASTVATLPVSYRSDALLLDGLDAVFARAALGDDRIRVEPVRAVHTGRLVQVRDHPAAVRLRVLSRDDLALTQNGLAKTAGARDAVLNDLTAEVISLLSGEAVLQPRDGGAPRQARPGDLAVLVRTNAQAQQVSSALGAAGVPVVVTGRASVFRTEAAAQWQLLLEAMEQPHRITRLRRLALSCFVGLSALELDSRGDAVTDSLALRLRSWVRVLEERGVGALFEAVSLTQAVQRRILGQQGGERLLTDLRHIAQTLHEAGQQGQLGLTGLLVWLRHRQDEAAGDGGLERSRRLESDAAAVQIITVHTSKGLEFPVVLVPFGWNHWPGNEPTTASFHEGDRRVRDIGGPGTPDWSAHVALHKQEETDDELRLAYVALTRAQSHLLLWWAPSYNTPQSPLNRLLLHSDPLRPAPFRVPVPSDADAFAGFEQRAAASSGALAVELIRARRIVRWAPPVPAAADLSAATFERALDTAWRRTSYSALTAAAHDDQHPMVSEPEIAGTDDELASSGAAALAARSADPDDPTGLRAVPSGWDELPSGPRFGTLVHSVLEVVPHLGDETAIRDAVVAEMARSGPPADADLLTTGLATAAATALGLLAGRSRRALRDFARSDRLCELDFELPLAGGEEATSGQALLSDLVPLWREHNPSGPLAGYAEALAGLDPAPLRGYLTGSIDVVLRVRPDDLPDSSDRYVVVDYKTNRLGTPGEPLTAWDYRPQALEQAMIEAHYPLQALLYSVALHRYLRWRQAGYDPAVHLGGCSYLFLRGMCGRPDAGGPGQGDAAPGVFNWRPATELVLRSSDLLAGR
jgi:exodeoxyribonuclease V beta subunit